MKGAENPNSRLSQKDVDAIRIYHAGGVIQKDLAAKFRIGQSQISNIIRRGIGGWQPTQGEAI